MADFCNQCAKSLALPHGDLAGLDLYTVVLCEGCGAIQVDEYGNCISRDCLENGHPDSGCTCYTYIPGSQPDYDPNCVVHGLTANLKTWSGDPSEPEETDALVKKMYVHRADTDSDPVHRDGGKWYFWIETWADRYGPYSTENEARKALKTYIQRFLGV